MNPVTSLYLFNRYVEHLASVAKDLNYALADKLGRHPHMDDLKKVLVFNFSAPTGNLYATSKHGCLGEFRDIGITADEKTAFRQDLYDNCFRSGRLELMSSFGKISPQEEVERIGLARLLSTFDSLSYVNDPPIGVKELSDKDTKQ